MMEFKATVRNIAPLVESHMGEALGELKYVSVTFGIEGPLENLGPVVRAEFKEPEKLSGKSELQRDTNAPVDGYLVRNGMFTASLLESPQLAEGASFAVKVFGVSNSND
jgi:hypothetical protein